MRGWEITLYDPILKQSFQIYCNNKGIQVLTDGSIWLDANGTITLYDWQFSKPGVTLDYYEVLDNYAKFKYKC